MAEIQVRKLKSSDFHQLLLIAGKMSNDALLTLIRQEGVTNFSAGLAFLSAALKSANYEIKELLCNLTGLTMEEYDEKDFEFPIEVLERVFDQQDMSKVFLRVKDLMGRIITK